MFDIYIRSVKDAIVLPFLKLVTAYKFSPNYITLSSGVFGLIGIYFSAQDRRMEAFIFYVLGRIMDGLDGAYARYTK